MSWQSRSKCRRRAAARAAVRLRPGGGWGAARSCGSGKRSRRPREAGRAGKGPSRVPAAGPAPQAHIPSVILGRGYAAAATSSPAALVTPAPATSRPPVAADSSVTSAAASRAAAAVTAAPNPLRRRLAAGVHAGVGHFCLVPCEMQAAGTKPWRDGPVCRVSVFSARTRKVPAREARAPARVHKGGDPLQGEIHRLGHAQRHRWTLRQTPLGVLLTQFQLRLQRLEQQPRPSVQVRPRLGERSCPRQRPRRRYRGGTLICSKGPPAARSVPLLSLVVRRGDLALRTPAPTA